LIAIVLEAMAERAPLCPFLDNAFVHTISSADVDVPLDCTKIPLHIMCVT